MLKLARRSLIENRRRYSAIIIAITISVAFVFASLVMSDTLTAMFRNIVTEGSAGIDAVVRTPGAINGGDLEQRTPVDAALADDLEGIDGVAAVEPMVFTYGQIIGADGERLGGAAPTVVTNWMEDPQLNTMELTEGHAPSRASEVVIDQDSATDGGLSVGDTVTVLSPDPLEFTLVGIARLTTSSGSLGGATVVKGNLEALQAITFGGANQANEIDLRAEPGTSETELAANISAALPGDLEVITGAEQTEEIVSSLNDEILSFLRVFLLSFAGVAMVAASLTIANSFAIVGTQRTREMALLRSLGASRRGVFVSSLLEATALGALSSALGIAVGLGLARGLIALLTNAIDMASSSPVVTAGTVLTAVVLGTVVTAIAAIAPMVRMSRISPVLALGSTAAEATRVSRVRLGIGSALIGLAATAMAIGATGHGSPIALVGLGSLGFVIGVVLVAPGSVAPLSWLFSKLGRTQSARFGRLNLVRSPRRAASAASALTVGIAIVTVITVMATSLRASVDESVSGGLRSDLIAVSEDGPLSATELTLLSELPELRDVSGYRTVPAEVFGSTQDLGLADAETTPSLIKVDGAGSTPWPDRLGANEVVVSVDAAADHDLSLGDSVPVTLVDGVHDMTVVGIHSSMEFLGNYVVSDDTPLPAGTTPDMVAIIADAAPGVSPEQAAAAANEAMDTVHGATVRTAQEYTDLIGSRINNLLVMVYALLALSVLIALVGIGTSMSLSISERGRELTLLHAVGMTRGRLRSMVRWESAFVACLGALDGVGAGLAIGAAFVGALNHDQGFGLLRLPGIPLLVIVAVGTAAGVIASIRPSRRAARLAGVASA